MPLVSVVLISKVNDILQTESSPIFMLRMCSVNLVGSGLDVSNVCLCCWLVLATWFGEFFGQRAYCAEFFPLLEQSIVKNNFHYILHKTNMAVYWASAGLTVRTKLPSDTYNVT